MPLIKDLNISRNLIASTMNVAFPTVFEGFGNTALIPSLKDSNMKEYSGLEAIRIMESRGYLFLTCLSKAVIFSLESTPSAVSGGSRTTMGRIFMVMHCSIMRTSSSWRSVANTSTPSSLQMVMTECLRSSSSLNRIRPFARPSGLWEPS